MCVKEGAVEEEGVVVVCGGAGDNMYGGGGGGNVCADGLKWTRPLYMYIIKRD